MFASDAIADATFLRTDACATAQVLLQYHCLTMCAGISLVCMCAGAIQDVHMGISLLCHILLGQLSSLLCDG